MKALQFLLLTSAWSSLLLMAPFALAQTWTQTSAPVTNWVSVASSVDGNKLVAAAYGGIVVQDQVGTVMPGPICTSTNSGLTWLETTAPTEIWQSVASSSNGIKLVAASIGNIYTSTDSGATWCQATNAPSVLLWRAIASSADGSELIAAAGAGSGAGSIFISTNSGTTWLPTSAPIHEHWSSVASSADGKKLLAVPQSGWIYFSTNSGATWIQASAPDFEWQAVAVSSDGTTFVAAAQYDYVLVDDGGPIYVSTNSGISWFQSGAPIAKWQAVASAADGARLLASVNRGGIYTSPDSGITWVENRAPSQIWTSVTSSGDGTKLVAVVNGSGIYIPMLGIALSSGEVVLSWPTNSINFMVQQNLDLSLTNWTDVTNSAELNLTNFQYELTVPLINGYGFYRLKTP